jgi:hypothetical protein
MANSIRTPKENTPQHIKEAVDNEEWQKFRLSLKGTQTSSKLSSLRQYLAEGLRLNLLEYNLRKTRVDNYLKALARGGQIEPAPWGMYVADLNSGCLEIRRE